MSAGAIRAGRAFISLYLDDSRLQRGLAKTRARLNASANRIGAIGGTLFAAGAAGVLPFVSAIRAASNLELVLLKVRAVFGATTPEIQNWARALANAVGDTQTNILTMLASAQDLLVPLGFEPGAAQEMSQTLVRLAEDLSAFNAGTSAADAMNDLQKALTGSTDTLLKYGVVADQAAIESRLLADGFTAAEAANPSKIQKVYATYALAIEKTAAAHGHALRIAKTYAAQTQYLTSTLQAAQETMGAALLAPAAAAAGAFQTIVAAARDWLAANQTLVPVAAAGALAIAGTGAALLLTAGALKLAALATYPIAAGLALITSPLGIATAALAGLGYAFATQTAAGQRMTSTLRTGLADTADAAVASFYRIGAHLAQGDLGAAAHVAATSIRTAFTIAINALRQPWLEWKAFFVDTYFTAEIALRSAWNDLAAGFATIWTEALAGMHTAWQNFTNAAAAAWNVVADFMRASWHSLRGALDDTFNADEAIDAMHAAGAARDSDRQNAHATALTQIAAERQARLDGIQKERDARQQDLDAERDALLDANAQLHRKTNAQLAAENAAARAAWRAAAEPDKPRPVTVTNDPDFQDPLQANAQLLQRLADAAKDAAGTATATPSGGYSAAALARNTGNDAALAQSTRQKTLDEIRALHDTFLTAASGFAIIR